MSLKAQNISFSYAQKTVLDNISFSMQSGQSLALIGPNGIGKSTLLKCLAGVLKSKNASLFLGEEELLSMPALKRARYLAYLPQQQNSVFNISVMDAILLGRAPFMRFGPSRKDKEKALKAAYEMGLEPYLFYDMQALSGGWRQRVFLARALAQEAKILVLDEPTSSMDIKNALDSFESILKLCKANGLMSIVCMHDINFASLFFDSFLMLKDAKIFAQGSASEVITEGNIKALYGVNSRVESIENRPHMFLQRS